MTTSVYMVYTCSNFTSNISCPLASDFPKFIQAAISSNMFIFFPFRLCEFQWRSRDNDRRMRLAGQLLHQLLKLACLLLLLMVRRMFIQTISIQRISVDIWLECSFIVCLVAESEHALLKMSAPHTDSSTPALPDFNRMTEEEQIAYALQMSMQGAGAG